MRKVIVFLVCLLFVCKAYGADHTITITIPEAKVAIALQGWLEIYPNDETIPDPEWVDPEDGSVVNQIPKYSNAQWVTEKVRRIIVRDVKRGLQMKANQEAQIAEDDAIATTE